MAKKQSKPEKNVTKAGKPARRTAGRPKRAARPIGPAELGQISRMWLAGHTLEDIGIAIGVSRQAIGHHLDATIRPLWRKEVCDPLGQELAKINLLERTAWKRFNSDAPCETTEQIKKGLAAEGAEESIVERVITTIRRPGQKAWLEVVQWCIEQRCKLAGHYTVKPEKEEHGTFRVAGMTAAQVNEEMIKRVTKLVRQRKKYEDAIKAAEGSEN